MLENIILICEPIYLHPQYAEIKKVNFAWNPYISENAEWPMKYQEKTYLAHGMHAINNVILAHIKGMVFHIKFLSNFLGRIAEDANREEHYTGAGDYKIYDSYTSKKAN